MKFLYEKIDIKYWSLYLKKLILNIEVCIWKNWYLILKFVFEKIEINIEVCVRKNWYQILQFVYERFDIRYFCLYLKN